MQANDVIRSQMQRPPGYRFLGAYASSSVSGQGGTEAHWFADGSALIALNEQVIDWIDEPITRDAFDTMTRAVHVLGKYTREQRAAQIPSLGKPDANGIVTYAGTRWHVNGDYRGIAWA